MMAHLRLSMTNLRCIPRVCIRLTPNLLVLTLPMFRLLAKYLNPLLFSTNPVALRVIICQKVLNLTFYGLSYVVFNPKPFGFRHKHELLKKGLVNAVKYISKMVVYI